MNVTIPVSNSTSPPTAAVAGTIRFNTDTDEMNIYDGTKWEIVHHNIIPKHCYE